MPNKHILQRSLVHLFPLEFNEDETKDTNEVAKIDETATNGNADTKNDKDVRSTRPKRKASNEARDKIYGQLIDD